MSGRLRLAPLFHASLLASVCLLSGCYGCGTDSMLGAGLELTPSEASLSPGGSQSFTAVYRIGLDPDDPEAIPDTTGWFHVTLRPAAPGGSEELPGSLTLSDSNGVLDSPARDPSSECVVEFFTQTLECTWQGTLTLAEDAPPTLNGQRFELEVRMPHGSYVRGSVVTLWVDDPTRDGGIPGADAYVPDGPDAYVPTGACEDHPCVNGTLRTDDGCYCVCDPGWLGAACDERPGVVTTLSGGPMAGHVDGAFEDARFDRPLGLELAPSGLLYVADANNHAVRIVDTAARTVATLAGARTRPSADGPVASAGFGFTTDVALASDGSLYVSQETPTAIRRVAGGMVTTLPLDLSTHSANGLLFVDTGGAGTLYLAGGWSVVEIDLATNALRVIAGNPLSAGRELADGAGAAASFAQTMDLSLGSDGRLFVSDWGSFMGGSIRLVDPTTGEVVTWVGAIDGPRRWVGSGPIERPAGILRLSGDDAIVAESGANRLRRFTSAPALTAPAFSLASVGDPWGGTTDRDGEAGFVDGEAPVSRFSGPRGLALAADGRSIYVSDSTNAAIRLVSF